MSFYGRQDKIRQSQVYFGNFPLVPSSDGSKLAAVLMHAPASLFAAAPALCSSQKF